VGARVAATLAEHFGSMEELLGASKEGLGNVEDVGEVIAESVYEFLHSQRGEKTVQRLRQAGVDMTAPKKPRMAASGALAGKTLVVTGTLENYSREEIEDLINAHGGRAAASVSKKTDFLVAGDKAGSKLERAQKLGVRVLNEAEFEAMIGKR
jgi:DNA ligase (NAD+)